MDDLWDAAGDDFGHWIREASLARADAEMQQGVMPFLLAARSEQELDHRIAIAEPSIQVIAGTCGLDADELAATARRQYALYREALMEGTDPLQQLIPELGGASGGPEKPDEHDEGPDFSHGYSEVPQGAQGGPDPAVAVPRPPSSGPVQEATGSLRRHAADSDGDPGQTMTSPYMPGVPDTGTGDGSVDTANPSAATNGMTPSLPAGGSGTATTPITPPSIGQVTSSADPVRRRVMAVTAAISATNPQLPQPECERVARLVVGRYLREADLNGSVMNDDPVGYGDSGSNSGDSGGSGGHGGMADHYLEWKGLRSMMPGSGGGAAAEGAGAAGEAAELAPLVAL